MESLNPKPSLLFDPIRKKWVEKTPEEVIRQTLLHYMMDSLGYPASLISVEKDLRQLPHLRHLASNLPNRRADILVFRQASLEPLLLIECKALSITQKFVQQVLGYNAFVRAPYVALANDKELITGYFDSLANNHHFQPGLPHYTAL